MDKVVIAGGTGFIGAAVSRELKGAGYEPVLLSRAPSYAIDPDVPRQVAWDGRTQGAWAAELDGALAIVNLAGSPISAHWSKKNKLSIVESRVESTRAIGEAISSASAPPVVWVNGSAVGYYGNRGDEELEEDSQPGQRGDFLADTCVAWEEEQIRANAPKTRKVRLRSGIALGRGGGVLQPLMLATMFFLGGRIGPGTQYISWIHVADLARIVRWAIETDAEGAVNGTAPNPATNDDFMAMLRAVLRRPWAPPMPAWALRLVEFFFGPPASLLLDGQRAIPAAAMRGGFEFNFPQLREAMVDVLREEIGH